MSLCAGRMKELGEGTRGGGDWIGDERKVVTPPSPPRALPLHFFPRPLLKNPDTSSGSNHTLGERCDIYGRAPTAKANIMSFLGTIHIVLPPVACGEE